MKKFIITNTKLNNTTNRNNIMKYSNEETFNAVKEIILMLFPYIDEKTITPNAHMKWNLGFDDFDKKTIIMQYEATNGGFFQYTSALKNAVTLGEFCNTFCNALNTENEKNIVAQTTEKTFLHRIKNFFQIQK